MGKKLFVFSHSFDGTTYGAHTLAVEMLECDLSHETVKVHSAISVGIAVRRQGVVGAAGIVACTFAGIVAEEHASGVDDLLCELRIVGSSYYKVFRGVGVAQCHRLVAVVDKYYLAVLKSFGSNVFAWQDIQLTPYFLLNSVYGLLRCGDKQNL